MHRQRLWLPLGPLERPWFGRQSRQFDSQRKSIDAAEGIEYLELFFFKPKE
jgi:hypothetical protein